MAIPPQYRDFMALRLLNPSLFCFVENPCPYIRKQGVTPFGNPMSKGPEPCAQPGRRLEFFQTHLPQAAQIPFGPKRLLVLCLWFPWGRTRRPGSKPDPTESLSPASVR